MARKAIDACGHFEMKGREKGTAYVESRYKLLIEMFMNPQKTPKETFSKRSLNIERYHSIKVNHRSGKG